MEPVCTEAELSVGVCESTRAAGKARFGLTTRNPTGVRPGTPLASMLAGPRRARTGSQLQALQAGHRRSCRLAVKNAGERKIITALTDFFQRQGPTGLQTARMMKRTFTPFTSLAARRGKAQVAKLARVKCGEIQLHWACH